MKIRLARSRARAAAVGVTVVVTALGVGSGLQLVGDRQPTVAEADGAAGSGEAVAAATLEGRAHEHAARRGVPTAATPDDHDSHVRSGRTTQWVTVRPPARAHQPPPAHGTSQGRDPQDHANRQDPGNAQDQAVSAAAERFLTDVAGLARPVPGPVERHGDTAEATFYGRGEDGQVARGLVTVVSLRRHQGDWVATGARTPTIVVDSPAPGTTVGSPLWVSGRAHTYEGTVYVRVVETLEDGYGELGRGFVTGGGDAMRPFEGEIPFAPPSSATGWVVFTEESAADGSTSRAAVVPVEMTHDPGCPEMPPPFPESPTWNPEVVLEDGWLRLPPGAGTLTVTVRATDADEVDLVLTPTGTGTEPFTEVVDTSTGSDGVFTVRMQYADAPLLGHLSLVARGPGGETAVDLAGVYHPDPHEAEGPEQAL